MTTAGLGGVNCLGGEHGTAVRTSSLSRHVGPLRGDSVVLFLKVARDENTQRTGDSHCTFVRFVLVYSLLVDVKHV